MNYVFLDTETTGLDADYHEVIQVALIVCDESLNKVAHTAFKIRPANISRASKEALAVNGYNARTWNPKFYTHSRALSFLNSFLSKYVDNLSESVLVGQNIKFDIGFLRAAYKKANLDYPFSNLSLDLMDLVKMWETQKGTRLKNRKLATLSAFTGCVNSNSHDAEADIDTTLRIFEWFLHDLKSIIRVTRK